MLQVGKVYQNKEGENIEITFAEETQLLGWVFEGVCSDENGELVYAVRYDEHGRIITSFALDDPSSLVTDNK